MLNFFEEIKENPGYYKQIAFDEVLFAEYKCPLAEKKMPIWSQNHYLIYVTRGRKIWHTPYGSWDLRAGDFVLVKSGACIVEQFFDSDFCLLIFFISDQFVRKTMAEFSFMPAQDTTSDYSKPILPIALNERLLGFIQSMAPYFSHFSSTDKPIIFLKFKELLLNLISSDENNLVSSFLRNIGQRTKPSLEEIMESNFCYNFTLEEFARLCCRSASTFKRDFKAIYKTTLSRWLRERRLNYAKILLSYPGKTITDVQLESGFENLSHFSKVFKETFGTSPQQYREKVFKLEEFGN